MNEYNLTGEAAEWATDASLNAAYSGRGHPSVIKCRKHA